METDHVTPISKGGSNSYNNLQLLHTQCHIEKTNQESKTHKIKKGETHTNTKTNPN